MFGDEQLVSRVFTLVSQDLFYGNVLPFPGNSFSGSFLCTNIFTGEFHFTMHVCHGIYRLGFASYLQPIAEQFNYTILKCDFDLKKWNKHDEFLLLFTEGALAWLNSIKIVMCY